MICCIFLSSALSVAQTASSSLRGVVKDPSGALVAGAKITLLDKANDKEVTAYANTAGSYVFPQIPPSTYSITVAAVGFAEQTKSAELLVDQPATINFNLTLMASQVTVDVSAAAQTLNTTDATLGDSVGNSTIQALPMEGRDPIALLTLQPGVLYLGNPAENDTMDSRSGSVNGGRSDQGNITLDGMDDNDEINGTAFTGVLRSTLDSTEEFRVTTSNGTAASGRSSGAQVSLITKTGTNGFHGAAYEYYRPTNTVSNQWFHKYTELFLGEPNTPQHYVQNTFGVAAGGPIKKDKLFFFANYEGQRKAIDDIVDQIVPVQQFYSGGLGYQDANNNTQWLTAQQVTAIDSANQPANGFTPCQTNVACGPNPNVIAYYQPLATAGIYGILSTVGDGVNNEGYIFASPAPATLNTSIAKLDYELTSNQHIFVRGNLQKDTLVGDENLPGQDPSSMYLVNTKGIAAGHTWTPTPSIVNDLRYAYIRQGYSTRGIGTGTGDWVSFRFLAQPTADTLSTVVNVPVQNITDNLTWSKGTHTLAFGANWRGIENNRGTDANSYSNASTNPYWLYDAPNDPCALGGTCPLVGSGFANSYEIAYDTLVGTVPSTTQTYNYAVTGATSGTLFADGALINRHFKANEFEYYIQDSWRIKPTLTITVGMRHSILQAPYESHGQEVSPTINTRAWFLSRAAAAVAGNPQIDPYVEPLSFAPSGKANHMPGYWAKQKDNIAPRFAIVFAPDTHTSIRAGFGMYHDHFGEGIVNSFDQEGSFGLSQGVTSPASYYTVQNSPRFTGPHAIPALSGCPSPATTVTYPFQPASSENAPNTVLNCGLAITWGIDNNIKTPYSYGLDLSFQHDLPGGFVFEENYVGRLGRHLLQQLDLAEPVNYVDPNGGGDYFTAARKLSKLTDQNGSNPNATVPTIPFFEDVFGQSNPPPAGESETQYIYSNFWSYYRDGAGETSAIYDLDLYPSNGGPVYDFFQSQFSSLYAWSSIGTSSYHALQFTFRHPASHGLTTDFSYTFSKSIDMGSGAERGNEFSPDAFSGTGSIQNSWNPKLNKGPSDFDIRSLVTVDAVYELPFGRGKAIAAGANAVVDAIIGGWQLSGLSRWASPLPFSVVAPGWATNWQQEGQGVVTGNVQVKRHIANGVPQVFAGTTATNINNGIVYGNPIRLPYPGEAGQRNNFRGDGYLDVDSSLAKTWSLHEELKLKFAAEVYNVANSVRFDDSPINLNASLTSGTFGAYGGMLSTYRRMQFGLRLDF
jgi:hypothetical protein